MASYYPPEGKESIQANRLKIDRKGIEFDQPRADLEVLVNAGILSHYPPSNGPATEEATEEVEQEQEVEVTELNERVGENPENVVEGTTDTSEVVIEQHVPEDSAEHNEVKPDQLTPKDKVSEDTTEDETTSQLTSVPKYSEEELEGLHHTKIRALANDEKLEYTDTADAKVKLLALTKTADEVNAEEAE